MTSIPNIFVCLISLIIIQSCGSSENHQKKNSDEVQTPDTVSINNDLLPPPPKPGPAPGHAIIRARIADIQEPEDRSDVVLITFYIIGIEEYGPSTPPLATRDSVKVKAKTSTVEKKEISSGKIVTAVISYQQIMLGYSETPGWSLVELE